ncbi:hypothetical protein F4V43_11350 [Paenibacillus spiritus]|uniref:Uncharacterized protein n=1 Tax=Paenibacillus spiritus TaxID=2496557 RepID=A0A5J5G8C7_9BACL|nr:hypothetical protein [Paenibacillus spiritus]KAA9003998.1 hypothetical protein F4V43_11350 [Paenibacillus spiritus]
MFIDVLLLVLYGVSIGCALYIIHRHRTYFHERFRKGVVSVFMLAMLFFLTAYVFKLCVVLLIRIAMMAGAMNAEMERLLTLGWTLAQIGTTTGLIALAWLTWSGKYDQFVALRRLEQRGEQERK